MVLARSLDWSSEAFKAKLLQTGFGKVEGLKAVTQV